MKERYSSPKCWEYARKSLKNYLAKKISSSIPLSATTKALNFRISKRSISYRFTCVRSHITCLQYLPSALGKNNVHNFLEEFILFCWFFFWRVESGSALGRGCNIQSPARNRSHNSSQTWPALSTTVTAGAATDSLFVFYLLVNLFHFRSSESHCKSTLYSMQSHSGGTHRTSGQCSGR